MLIEFSCQILMQFLWDSCSSIGFWQGWSDCVIMTWYEFKPMKTGCQQSHQLVVRSWFLWHCLVHVLFEYTHGIHLSIRRAHRWESPTEVPMGFCFYCCLGCVLSILHPIPVLFWIMDHVNIYGSVYQPQFIHTFIPGKFLPQNFRPW